eukprot:gene35148-45041_t
MGPFFWGIVVWALGLSLGGPTGYAINPARDLGPRIAHAILPIAGKRDSDWGYAWVPVIAPLAGATLGADWRGLGSGLCSGRWHPGLGRTTCHTELFAPDDEASGAAMALALALDAADDPADHRPWLWVQDKAAIRHSGRPYRPGLPAALRHRLIHVAADRVEDALFALEEGVRCRDLAFVVGEVAGNPAALDFTASRRLSLAAQRRRLGPDGDLRVIQFDPPEMIDHDRARSHRGRGPAELDTLPVHPALRAARCAAIARRWPVA